MHFQSFIRFEITLAAEPVFHGRFEAPDRDAVPSLQQTVTGGQSVVENCFVGEVAHGEVVDPLNGARMSGAA